jgi:hypothetical protein
MVRLNTGEPDTARSIAKKALTNRVVTILTVIKQPIVTGYHIAQQSLYTTRFADQSFFFRMFLILFFRI